MATANAVQKLEKEKYCSPINKEVIFKIIAFITKPKAPRVKIVIGNENKCSKGFTHMLRIDKTKLATIAITKLLTYTFVGNKTDSETKVKVLTIKR